MTWWPYCIQATSLDLRRSPLIFAVKLNPENQRVWNLRFSSVANGLDTSRRVRQRAVHQPICRSLCMERGNCAGNSPFNTANLWLWWIGTGGNSCFESTLIIWYRKFMALYLCRYGFSLLSMWPDTASSLLTDLVQCRSGPGSWQLYKMMICDVRCSSHWQVAATWLEWLTISERKRCHLLHVGSFW